MQDRQTGKSCLLAPPEGPGYSPGVGLLITVIQGLKTLLLLLFAELGWVRDLEEGRSKFHKPPGVDGGDLTHILLRGQHQLMVYHPEEGQKQAQASDRGPTP